MPTRGNPDWGKPPQRIPVRLTEFDEQVARMGLTKPQYIGSAELRRWCERNRNRVYIPEWLLKAWAIRVEDTFSGFAS